MRKYHISMKVRHPQISTGSFFPGKSFIIRNENKMKLFSSWTTLRNWKSLEYYFSWILYSQCNAESWNKKPHNIYYKTSLIIDFYQCFTEFFPSLKSVEKHLGKNIVKFIIINSTTSTAGVFFFLFFF